MSQHIYRHKVNRQLYTIEHLLRDIKHTNNNIRRGIYAFPYGQQGSRICYTFESQCNQNQIDYTNELFDPLKFVEDHFEIVAELL